MFTKVFAINESEEIRLASSFPWRGALQGWDHTKVDAVQWLQHILPRAAAPTMRVDGRLEPLFKALAHVLMPRHLEPALPAG